MKGSRAASPFGLGRGSRIERGRHRRRRGLGVIAARSSQTNAHSSRDPNPDIKRRIPLQRSAFHAGGMPRGQRSYNIASQGGGSGQGQSKKTRNQSHSKPPKRDL